LREIQPGGNKLFRVYFWLFLHTGVRCY